MKKLFAVLVLAFAAVAPAFAADKPVKIGFLSWYSPAMTRQLDYFREGMQQFGYAAVFVRETKAAADRLGVKVLERLVDGPEAIDQALFDAIKRDGAEAVIVQPIFAGHEERIAAMALRSQLPMIAESPSFADAGALVAYGPDDAVLVRRAAYYVDRILKGTKPTDLPIEQPTQFELVLNARTTTALGWTIPQSVLMRADRVIE